MLLSVWSYIISTFYRPTMQQEVKKEKQQQQYEFWYKFSLVMIYLDYGGGRQLYQLKMVNPKYFIHTVEAEKMLTWKKKGNLN